MTDKLDNSKRVGRWYFGGLASAGAACCTHPLDLLKVHLQTQQQGKLSLGQMAVKVVKADGFLGLYNGLSASILRQLTYSTTRFGMYETLKKQFPQDKGPLPFYQKALLAGVSGACGGFVGTPGDMINVRMQNDMKVPPEMRRNYKHAIDGIYKIYTQEGLKSLFNGATMATGRAVLMTIGQLSFYDQIKQMLLESGYVGDNLITHFSASFLAASIATMMTQPMDVLKTRMMNAKPGEFKGVVDCCVYTAKLGPLGFFKGFIPAWIRLAPHTVLTFIFFEQLRFHFGYFANNKFPSLIPLVVDAYKQWAELERATGQQLFKETGLLWMSDAASIAERSAILAKFAMDHEVLTNKEVATRFPQFSYDSSWTGLFDPKAGVLFANRCLTVFQEEFKRLGGTIQDGEPVIAFQPGSTVTITTARSTYTADSVVFCLGSWLGHFVKDIQLKVQPEAVRVCYWQAKEPERYSPDAFPCLIVTTPEGEELYGLPIVEYPGMIKLCLHEGAKVHPDHRDLSKSDAERFVAVPRAHIAKHFPGLISDRPAIVDTCMYTMTPDHQFILDRHPRYANVVIGGGFSGAGFKFAPTVGHILALFAINKAPPFDLSAFRLSRHFSPLSAKLLRCPSASRRRRLAPRIGVPAESGLVTPARLDEHKGRLHRPRHRAGGRTDFVALHGIVPPQLCMPTDRSAIRRQRTNGQPLVASQRRARCSSAHCLSCSQSRARVSDDRVLLPSAMAFATLLVSLACVTFAAAQQQQPPNPAVAFGPTCDAASQQRISTCSRELMTLGIFGQNAGQVDALTFNDLRRRSRDYFLQICNAYNRFNQCLGGSYIKQACYPQEPIKARFAVADAALEYVCGEGYNEMISKWDCYLGAATRADVTICETRIAQDAAQAVSAAQYQAQQPRLLQYSDYQTGSNACNALRNYMDCIKRPIESTCGTQSWNAVVQAIQRPVHVYLPYCTLAGAAHVPSLITIVTLLIAAVVAKAL
uniref:FAD dependent oxidoreductase domain-containing protein n=1 Tax=Plectus sambesii TaxID=2011161 RepID=A0A914VZL4_9BILA